jgi:hypothetical protein
MLGAQEREEVAVGRNAKGKRLIVFDQWICMHDLSAPVWIGHTHGAETIIQVRNANNLWLRILAKGLLNVWSH